MPTSTICYICTIQSQIMTVSQIPNNIQKGAIMKIDRQLGILSILLQTESVTTPYLSDMFEVSRRTINRDIEDLCKAGGYRF